ncbi:MAG TPA: hypothetical protein VGB51_00565 [Actinomycetota bacterium]
MLRDEARVLASQSSDGSWHATLDDGELGAPTLDACVGQLRRALPGRALILELRPKLLGVAEAASLLGWDRRRVITYVDRGSFPEPLESLAGGRVWALDDVREFHRAFLARRERRNRRAARAAASEPSASPD